MLSYLSTRWEPPEATKLQPCHARKLHSAYSFLNTCAVLRIVAWCLRTLNSCCGEGTGARRCRHLKPRLRSLDCGPRAWKAILGRHAIQAKLNAQQIGVAAYQCLRFNIAVSRLCLSLEPLNQIKLSEEIVSLPKVMHKRIIRTKIAKVYDLTRPNKNHPIPALTYNVKRGHLLVSHQVYFRGTQTLAMKDLPTPHCSH